VVILLEIDLIVLGGYWGIWCDIFGFGREIGKWWKWMSDWK
jgi:hypothetical protein